MNILTGRHERRNLLRVPHECTSMRGNQHCSLRAAAGKLAGSSGTSNSMVLNSSNFKIEQSFPRLSNQLDSESIGRLQIGDPESVAKHIASMSQNRSANAAKRADQIECLSRKSTNEVLGKRSCYLTQVRAIFPGKNGLIHGKKSLNRVGIKQFCLAESAMAIPKKAGAVDRIARSSKVPDKSQSNQVNPGTRLDPNPQKSVALHKIDQKQFQFPTKSEELHKNSRLQSQTHTRELLGFHDFHQRNFYSFQHLKKPFLSIAK